MLVRSLDVVENNVNGHHVVMVCDFLNHHHDQNHHPHVKQQVDCNTDAQQTGSHFNNRNAGGTEMSHMFEYIQYIST